MAFDGVELLDHDQLAGRIKSRGRGIPGEAREAGVIGIVRVNERIRMIRGLMEVVNVEKILAGGLPELRVEGAAEDAAVFVRRGSLVPVHVPDAVADIEGGGELGRSRGVVVWQTEDPAVHFSDHHFTVRSGPRQGGDGRLPAQVREGGDGIHLGGHDRKRGEFPAGKRRDGLGTAEAGDALGVRAERDRARRREI